MSFSSDGLLLTENFRQNPGLSDDLQEGVHSLRVELAAGRASDEIDRPLGILPGPVGPMHTSSWNITRGCSVVGPGCTSCYAMKHAPRFEAYRSLAEKSNAGPVWTGRVRGGLSPIELLAVPTERNYMDELPVHGLITPTTGRERLSGAELDLPRAGTVPAVDARQLTHPSRPGHSVPPLGRCEGSNSTTARELGEHSSAATA